MFFLKKKYNKKKHLYPDEINTFKATFFQLVKNPYKDEGYEINII